MNRTVAVLRLPSIAGRFLILTVTMLFPALPAVQPAAASPADQRAGSSAPRSDPARAIPLGSVRYIRRGLLVRPPHHAAEKGKVNMPLFDRYFLETGPGQAASIRFRDGTTLYMSQRTDVTLSSRHVTSVRRGEIDQVVAQGTDHRVKAAHAEAVARGTNFDVRVTKRGALYVVAHGAVEVRNARGAVLVLPDHKTFVAPRKAPQPPTPANSQATIAWANTMPPANIVEVTSVSSNAFQVTFVSKQPGQGRVMFGPGPGCLALVEVGTRDAGSGTTRHSVLVSGNDSPGTVGNIGLSPGARYFFQVATVTSSGTEIDNNHGKCYTVTIPRALR